MDLNSLKVVALIGVIHGIVEVIEKSLIVLIALHLPSVVSKKNTSLGKVSNSST